MAGNCPICKKPTVEATKPFCSKRCADIDLGRWFGESYAVATNEAPDEAENLPKTPEIEE